MNSKTAIGRLFFQ